MLAYVGVAFAVEPFAWRGGEVSIGVTTWLVLLASLRSSPPSERAQVATVVLMATAGEILGSLVLGVYEYRRGGIPAFVPPGHAALFACMLFFVAVLELYGTAMGTWQWAAHWPGLHIPQANPPSAVAAGYCAFDALALRLGPRLQRTAMRPFSTRTSYVGCG